MKAMNVDVTVNTTVTVTFFYSFYFRSELLWFWGIERWIDGSMDRWTWIRFRQIDSKKKKKHDVDGDDYYDDEEGEGEGEEQDSGKRAPRDKEFIHDCFRAKKNLSQQ